MRIWLAGLLALASACALPALAQPDLSRRIGHTVADAGAPGYRFERIVVPMAGRAQGYRLQLAIPMSPAPAGGFPAVWLVDGNAALMETAADLLADLARSPSPPVLIYVAHDNDLRIDGEARAYDYTPRLPGDDAAQVDAMGRRNGGADAFLAWLAGPARRQASERVPLDPARQALWGHSYGGVLVLHALFAHAGAFTGYAAVDPSLWWGQGQLLRSEGQARPAPDASLWLAAGEAVGPAREAPPPPRGNPQANAELRRARTAAPPDAARQLVLRLRERGVQAQYVPLPGLSHGQTLGASLPLFLRHFSGLAESP